VALGVPRLAAQFGAAELDKAVADAALRAAGQDWVAGLRAGLLGDPFTASLALQAPARVNLRHTVGLADRLTAPDPGPDPDDGLPATLDAAIAEYGLRFFKLKLSGRAEADVERLARIAAVLEANARDWHVTLDGNETFDSADALGAWWRAFAAEPRLRILRQRTLLLEQPLARRVALAEPIGALDIGVPVILDESDDHADVFERGLALGYRGISSKACKGL
jgi:L-alanine-DL-glutamate epimerase-like enolase superfamily enzyme